MLVLNDYGHAWQLKYLSALVKLAVFKAGVARAAVVTSCAMPAQPTCSKTAPTSDMSRNNSATPSSKLPRFTPGQPLKTQTSPRQITPHRPKPGLEKVKSMRTLNTMRFTVTIDRDEDGIWVAECPAIPGCVSQGESKDEALENVREAILACLEVRAEQGMPLTVETRQIEIAV